jgi:hypothetical protein
MINDFFHKNFYSLNEASAMLSIDEDTLLHMHISRNLKLSVHLKSDYYCCIIANEERLLDFIRVFVENITEDIRPNKYEKAFFYDIPLIGGESVRNIKGEVLHIGTDLAIDSIKDNCIPLPYISGSELRENGKIINHILHNNSNYIPLNWLVIEYEELMRLLNLKSDIEKNNREQPTAEDLKAENELLKQRIADLNAQLAEIEKNKSAEQRRYEEAYRIVKDNPESFTRQFSRNEAWDLLGKYNNKIFNKRRQGHDAFWKYHNAQEEKLIKIKTTNSIMGV